MKKIRISFLCILCLFIVTAQAQAIHFYHFKNGLNLYVKVDKRAPIAVFQVWYKVGSSYEPYGLTGISHLTEHMMFDGTPKYPPGKLTTLLTTHGALFNAFTSRDFTAYYEEIAVKNLPLVFMLESDRMVNLSITDQQFNKEINVVREERRLRTDDQPPQIAYERFNAAAFVSSPYHHPVVGWMDDLNHMSPTKVRRWYHNWYMPNNATIVIVGDVDPNKMRSMTQKYFGYLRKRTLPSVPATAEIPSLGMRDVTVHTPAKLPLLFMGYNVPSLVTAKNKWKVYALDVLSEILSGDSSSRFARNLIRGKEIASSAEADYDPFTRLSSLFILYGTPTSNETIAELQKAFEKQIKQLQTDLVKPEELQRVKTQVIAEKVYDRDSLINQASEIGAIVSVGLPETTVNSYTKNIDAVTAEQVREVAREYLVQKNLTRTILKPMPLSEKDKQRISSAASMSGSIR